LQHAQMRVAPRAAARQHEADRRPASFTVGKFANPIGFDRGDIGRKPLPNISITLNHRYCPTAVQRHRFAASSSLAI
ncbi:hypothetical protein, partial [Burkholderia pseudomallei]|uniref:hypothetical protein n=1 Tax=Burkholderia pseudomallei TaxID=28450 RepID=UPI001C8375A0